MTITKASILKTILMLVTKIILSKCEISLIYVSKKKINLYNTRKLISIDFEGYTGLRRRKNTKKTNKTSGVAVSKPPRLLVKACIYTIALPPPLKSFTPLSLSLHYLFTFSKVSQVKI